MRTRWASAADLVKTFKFRAGVQPDQMSILNAIWEKEIGGFSKHWALVGVRRGVLYVQPRSSAAAQELQMRSGGVVRALNKYFGRPWVKAIRIKP